uniref:Iron-sulfur clusters transporter ABCB7, mitochondrial n=1 Tax=Meloidogyne enterolobii TaxID=390850 RepID=A0A6V7W103_MELEN|nr:unnamed protein product [Meloidogyne enterolobii]
MLVNKQAKAILRLLSNPYFMRRCAINLRRTIKTTSHHFLAGPSNIQHPIQIGGPQPNNWQMIQKLARHVWPARGEWNVKRRVILAMTLLVAAKLLNATVPFLLRDVINYFDGKLPSGFSSLGLSTPSGAVLSTGIALIIAYGAARAGTSLFNELRNAVFARVAHRSIRDIARNIFLHLHSLDLSYHLNRQTGALSKAIDRGTRGMSTTLNSLVFNIIPTIFEMALVGTIFYIKCGPQFTFAMTGCLGMYAVATIGITRWRTKFRLEMNEADNEAGNRAIDSLINYETVKYFNNEKLEADRYDHFLRRFEFASLKTSTSLALLNFTQNAIFSAGLIGVMALAAENVKNGTMTVGDIILVNTLLFQMSIPLNFLGSMYRDIRQGLLDMQVMFALTEKKSRIVENPCAKPLIISQRQSKIIFEDVVFGYVPSRPMILNGLSFEVPSGMKVAIVGGSGSGKSTIVRLLYRLFDANSGKITINGQEIINVQLDSLRRAIAIIPQDSVLFNDTIYYNIHYGNINASEEQVYQAAKTADLHDSIMRIPHAYQTMVGERGLKLSGGEKQRVAIARAILKNSPIIVYDEATSSLDSITEENIMHSLKSAYSGRTSLFIAHRLVTIADADIIYVLDEGRVIETGTHKQLLAKEGKYAELWNSQNRHRVDASGGGQEESPTQSQFSTNGSEIIHFYGNDLLEFEELQKKCCGNMSCNR